LKFKENDIILHKEFGVGIVGHIKIPNDFCKDFLYHVIFVKNGYSDSVSVLEKDLMPYTEASKIAYEQK